MNREMTLIEVKLRPHMGFNIFERKYLKEKILNNINAKLAVITAPAGYGKTVLAFQIVKELEGFYVWYQFDDLDNDPFVFLKHLFAALSRYLPGVGMNTGSMGIDYAAAAFLQQLESLKDKKIYMVFDDFHLLKEKQILEFLDRLLKHMPRQLFLIISGRKTPALNLAPMIAANCVVEINKEDIAFSFDEFMELLNAPAPNDAEDMLRSVYGKTEGWPLASCLAVQVYRSDRRLVEDMVTAMYPGSALSEFFSREIMEKVTDEIKQFLMKTSIFDNLTPEICAYITGVEASGEVLRYLHRHNLFITRLSGADEVYVYHQLLRDYLRQRLGKQKNELLVKAGRYCFAHGKNYVAMEYFIKAEDVENSLKVFKKSGIQVLRHGRLKTVERWLTFLKGICPQDNTDINLMEGAINLYRGDVENAVKCLDSAYGGFAKKNDRGGLNQTILLISRIMAYKGNFEGSMELIDTIISGCSHGDTAIYEAYMQKAHCMLIKGDFNQMELTLKTGMELLQRQGDKRSALFLQRYLAVPYYLKGELKKAISHYELTSKMTGEEIEFDERFSVDLYIAGAYRSMGELGKSKELMENTIDKKKSLGYEEDLYLAYYHLSLLYRDMGDYESAMLYSGLTEELIKNGGPGGLADWFISANETFRGLLLAECGDIAGGTEYARKAIAHAGEPSFLLSAALCTAGNVFIKAAEFEDAEENINKALKASKSAGLKFVECYGSGLLCHIYSRKGKPDKALEFVRRSLKLAAEINYIQVYLTCHEMLDCIQVGMQYGIESEFLCEIVRRLESSKLQKVYGNMLGSGAAVSPDTLRMLVNVAQKDWDFLISAVVQRFFYGGQKYKKDTLEFLEAISEAAGDKGPPRLLVSCVDSFETNIAGKGKNPLTWRTNKAMELFIYMALYRGNAVHTERILADIWPDVPPQKARDLLYTTMGYIKRILGENDLKESLRKTQQGYILDTRGIACDVWLIEDELGRRNEWVNAGIPEWLSNLAKKDFNSRIYSEWFVEKHQEVKEAIEKALEKCSAR